VRLLPALLALIPGTLFPSRPACAQYPPLSQVLQRVAEEAEVFRSIARDVVSEETLTHRWLKPPSRFRPRAGQIAVEPPKPKLETRQIVSEYAFGYLKEAPGILHEFRQVVSVDGRRVLAAEKARRSLSLNLRSEDDAVKKQLLRDFEKNGLRGAATTDFGQILLLFSKRRLPGYRFEPKGTARLGAEEVILYSYEETRNESLTVFAGRNTVHQALKGELWVRKSDFVPLRVTMDAERPENDYFIHIDAAVDYAPTAHGVVLPVSVLHRESAKGVVLTENQYRYAPFKKFSAETELKFEIQDPK
jgi:hypothetical protein